VEFVFAIVFIQVLLINFFKIVEVVRAVWIHTFVDGEVFTVLLWNQGVSAIRVQKTDRGSDLFTGNKTPASEYRLNKSPKYSPLFNRPMVISPANLGVQALGFPYPKE